MGFVVSSSSFLCSPMSAPSSHHAPSSPLLLLCPKRRSTAKKVLAVSSSDGDGDLSGSSSNRRAILLVGVSVLPLFHLRAIAVENLVKGASTHDASPMPLEAFEQSLNLKHEATLSQISFSRRKKNLYKDSIAKPEVQGASDENTVVKPEKEGISDEENVVKSEIQGISDEDNVIKPEIHGLQQAGKEVLLQEPNQSEPVKLQERPGNPFVSLLNGLGIVGSGILGALYATSQKEKAALELSIESMKTKLTKDEAAASSMKENYETRLLNMQEEQQKQARKFQEEEASLLNQLSSAKSTCVALGEELRREIKLAEELKAEIGRLESSITQAGEDKRILESKIKEKIDVIDVLQDKVSLLSLEINDKEKNIGELKLSLESKEKDYKSLSSMFVQSKGNLETANSTIEQLKEEISTNREELSAKTSSIDSLNEKIKSLHAANREIEEKIHGLVEDYENLRSSSERRASLDSELLAKKDGQLYELEGKLAFALSEASNDHELIKVLKKERDDLKVAVEREIESVRKLKDELKSTEETLELLDWSLQSFLGNSMKRKLPMKN
uniref:MAR-binding filament-like protein 1-1 n=1 Tax=Ananas comosus var. bracteatus TaxID=296719 RepID=A0A6V7QJR5_ANACO|nr:unnamed protein product [Ananas comosus var. bracteatus]